MPSADAAEIRRALDLMVRPGDVVELRALSTGKWGPVVSGYFTDLDKLTAHPAKISLHAAGVYITANPVDPKHIGSGQ